MNQSCSALIRIRKLCLLLLIQTSTADHKLCYDLRDKKSASRSRHWSGPGCPEYDSIRLQFWRCGESRVNLSLPLLLRSTLCQLGSHLCQIDLFKIYSYWIGILDPI